VPILARRKTPRVDVHHALDNRGWPHEDRGGGAIAGKPPVRVGRSDNPPARIRLGCSLSAIPAAPSWNSSWSRANPRRRITVVLVPETLGY